ncbi:DUF2946 domain-containing protein [Scandinavium manionii]|uniref:DUF2946 domain-containing protein n=1 Tax=Scandinavium manionii TaxID=2926520 RepID=UPI00135C0537|nr:DUF2946 domain-containing protein [Scandinavium manionii]MCS2146904.1 DUF2946 domain-containing protein [Scandinavium manionii]MCS2164962.1 DUF2946 domain-containing protein [Scandinavium manionii]
MAENTFHRSNDKRVAVWFALFAIALIIVAPRISVSLQKDPMSAMPGMHHDMSMMSGHHDGHHSGTTPVDHAVACGYCVLLAHVPGLILALVLLVCALLLRLRLRPPRLRVQVWHFSPWLYPHTRAPPRLSAFTC